MRKATTLGGLMLTLAFLVRCQAGAGVQVTGREPIVGGPCEGCEAVFEGVPEHLVSRARIAP
jgi:protocatechuate 3,4-dioxygenase beta subunit